MVVLEKERKLPDMSDGDPSSKESSRFSVARFSVSDWLPVIAAVAEAAER